MRRDPFLYSSQERLSAPPPHGSSSRTGENTATKEHRNAHGTPNHSARPNTARKVMASPSNRHRIGLSATNPRNGAATPHDTEALTRAHRFAVSSATVVSGESDAEAIASTASVPTNNVTGSEKLHPKAVPNATAKNSVSNTTAQKAVRLANADCPGNSNAKSSRSR